MATWPGGFIGNYLSLWVGFMFAVYYMYTSCSKLTIANCYISARMLSAMAAGDTRQTTPAQIVHIFVLCCSTQIVGVLQF